ncbi:MAG: ATP-binding protein [Ruminococcus sp.]|nr:ATP-binding protein [Ruminococcus sp.]
MNDFLQLLQVIKPDIEIHDIPDPYAYARMQTQWYNENTGNLNEADGIDCPVCRNKGTIQYVDDNGHTHVKDCSCMVKRNAVRAMQNSGLGGLIEKTIGNYQIYDHSWQDKVIDRTMQFINDESDTWLYFAGQTGSGKTHLCTAACTALMDKGRRVKYMLWGKISQKLNALKYKVEEFEQYLHELKNVDVLYIDDFLKTPTNANGVPDKPLTEDVRNAYTVINARYFANKKTIISSEHFISEYNTYDGAAAGRIKQMAKIIIQIERKPERDYRKRRASL